MFDSLFNNYDTCKTYKTVANLEAALTKIGVTKQHGAVLVQVPTGKNVGRYTAIFPWQDGRNNAIIFLGFKVMG